MNKRFYFHPLWQRDRVCDWEIYLDFRRIGAITIEAEDSELNLNWQVCVKRDGREREKETDSRYGVLKFLEETYASELAVPRKVPCLDTDESGWEGTFYGIVTVGELTLASYQVDAGHSNHRITKLKGIADMFKGKRFSFPTKQSMLDHIRDRYRKELGL